MLQRYVNMFYAIANNQIAAIYPYNTNKLVQIISGKKYSYLSVNY